MRKQLAIMFVGCAVLMVLGCASVSQLAIAHRHHMSLQAAVSIYGAVDQLPPIQLPEALKKLELLYPAHLRADTVRELVQRDALDVIQRMKVGLSNEIVPPGEGEKQTPIIRLSPLDADWYHTDVGIQKQVGARRRFFRELPDMLLNLAVTGTKRLVLKIVPMWVIVGGIIGGIGYIVLLVYAKWLDLDRKRKQRERAEALSAFNDLDDAVDRALPSKARRKIRLSGVSLTHHNQRNDERKLGA